MSQPHPLDRARLQEILDRYGSDPQGWPSAERAAAQQLCSRDPQARQLCEQAASLDVFLDGLPEPVPSAQLRRAVAEIPLRHPRATPSAAPWLIRRVWRAALSAALVAGLGVLAGAMTVEAEDAHADWSTWTTWTLAATLDEELMP